MFYQNLLCDVIEWKISFENLAVLASKILNAVKFKKIWKNLKNFDWGYFPRPDNINVDWEIDWFKILFLPMFVCQSYICISLKYIVKHLLISYDTCIF